MDITVGDPNLMLCTRWTDQCFRTRVVMTTKKFPGFGSSSYRYISYAQPSVLITEDQLKFLIKELSPGPEKEEDLNNLPVSLLNLKLRDDRALNKNEVLRLKSMINTHVDTNKVWIFDYRDLKSKMDESLQTMLLFLSLITALLFLMSFSQLLLSIEGNIRDNQWQIGVLRAMGLTKHSVKSIVLTEATANILTAVLIGFFVGYIVMVTSMSVMNTIFELPINFDVDWQILCILMGISILTVIVGTNMGVR